MIHRLISLAALSLGIALAGCGNQTDMSEAEQTGPLGTLVFPDMPEPDPFNRAYVMTESPDGQLRLFTKETRDDTDIFTSRRQDDGSWSEPQLLDWPKYRTNQNPHFSPFDDRLYFGSDRPVPGLDNRSDTNLWSVSWDGTSWGEAEPVPGDVNTGANETTVSITQDGMMYFVSNHPRGQGGQDIYQAVFSEDSQQWMTQSLPENISSHLVESHVTVTPDGKNLVFYSRIQPILGVVDIKAVTLQEDGSWLGPYTLGPRINTPGIDFGTGRSHDGETFFFSREGRMMELPMSELYGQIELAKQAYLAGDELSFLGLPEN